MKNSGYFRVLNKIFDLPISSLGKLVFINLCRRANGSGASFPAHATIAHDCSLSERTVRRALAELTTHELLTIEIRKQQGRSNLYHIARSFRLPSQLRGSVTQTDPLATQTDPGRPRRPLKEDSVEGKNKKEEERGFFHKKAENLKLQKLLKGLEIKVYKRETHT